MISIAATIKDVAKYAGLSIATVSKYLNGGKVLEKNRKRIEGAIAALDFKVNELARGLKTNKTMTVGALIPNLDSIFITSIISKVENILREYGYSTIICDYKEDPVLEKEKINFLLDKMVDGIVVMPSSIKAEDIRKITAEDIPVVLVDRAIKDATCDVVLVDNLNASYDAVEQLIIRGHKRIGIICGPKDVFTTQERLKGYIRVHEDYAMQIDENLIKFEDYRLEGGYKALLELLEIEPSPTAVFVTNYEMTLGAIIAINEKDIKIPNDLSFIGFDNLQMARIVKPSLSIVVQPMEKIGETVANVLIKRLKGDKSNFPVMYRLKAEVLMRGSVKEITS